MAKTLIVKGADFEANALEQVVIEVIECTGISLDKDTLSIVTTGNTGTLVATKTPADTTQPVVWSTSNSDVVTVSNGVVTAVGVGSATVTVTCGNYSDTCNVTVTEFMDKASLMKMLGAYISDNNSLSAGQSGLTVIYTTSAYANRGTLAASIGTKYVNDFNGEHFYPYKMPKNTKRIKITDTGSSGIKKQSVFWYNTETSATTTGYENYCGVLGGTGVSPFNENPYIVDVPTYPDLPDVDSLLVMFRTYKSGTTFVDTDFDEVSVEFLPAAE